MLSAAVRWSLRRARLVVYLVACFLVFGGPLCRGVQARHLPAAGAGAGGDPDPGARPGRRAGRAAGDAADRERRGGDGWRRRGPFRVRSGPVDGDGRFRPRRQSDPGAAGRGRARGPGRGPDAERCRNTGCRAADRRRRRDPEGGLHQRPAESHGVALAGAVGGAPAAAGHARRGAGRRLWRRGAADRGAGAAGRPVRQRPRPARRAERGAAGHQRRRRRLHRHPCAAGCPSSPAAKR